jgi:hypothetical protein
VVELFIDVLGADGVADVDPLEGLAAGVVLGVLDELDDELSPDAVVLFSPAFDALSAAAAGLSAFASRSDLPPSDFGADPLSPFG